MLELNMDNAELSFTLAYLVFSFCFIFTPNEFHAAGLTVQNVFGSWLGSEEVGFIQYHVKRTSITLLVHSAMPLGYHLGLCIAAPAKNPEYLDQLSETWKVFFTLTVLLHLSCWMLIFYWSWQHWKRHPISRSLQAHTQPPFSSWQAVASNINTEFRRIDKFASGGLGARIIVTDSWVLKVTTYFVHMTLQTECHVTVTESRQHELSPDPNTPIEMLKLRVESINPAVKAFSFGINSTDYSDLREKLRAPIRVPSNVVIHQTISELFLETFRSQVELNQAYTVPDGQEVDLCIGCMQAPARTKLVRLCQDAGADNETECQECFCRPMWCLTCLGRWFASRQDQHRPETWLSSKVPCPTCRAKFCILDICAVR